VLLVIAEPCRNIGKYTMGDILAFRNNPKTVKTFMALSTITVYRPFESTRTRGATLCGELMTSSPA
jgi:Na+(H+)/acetate symporter ActP